MTLSLAPVLRRGCAALCLLVPLTLLLVLDAQAYPDEVAGFLDLSWGATPAELLAKRPGLRKKGYRLPKLRASLKRSAGGIFIAEVAPYESFSDAELRYHVSKAGLFRVEARLVDRAPGRYAAARELVAALEKRHGPPTDTEPKVWIWKGAQTVLRLQENLAIAGVDLTLTVTRRAEHDAENE